MVTADQVGSRSGADAVPEALDALVGVPEVSESPQGVKQARAFARTAGDEIQALFDDSNEAVRALEVLARLGQWRVGVGIGAVESPVPDDVRAATGEAFVAAREAVEASRLAPARIAVRAPSAPDEGQDVEAALALVQLVWHRRSDAGWDVAELLAKGASGRDVARELGITPSAVSQRAKAAGVEETAAGMRLVVRLLDRARRTRSA